MLSFEKLEIKHINLIRKYLSTQDIGFCDYTPAGFMMWRNYFNIEIAEYHDTLFTKCSFRDLGTSFMLPICLDKSYFLSAIDVIEEYTLKHKMDFRICLVSEEASKILEAHFGELCNVTTHDAWYDYVYDANAFSSLVGRKYNGQRNHINKFKKLYDGYSFVKIDENTIGKAKEFCASLCDPSADPNDMRETEARAASELLDYFLEGGFVGGYLEHDGRVLAIGIGERIGDTMYQHIEKALPNIDGAYQTIAYEFANAFASGCRYINREEDEGVPGLRKAKLSNHPEVILKKYVVSKCQ